MEPNVKAELIVAFTSDCINDPQYSEFFEYNDLGIPVAVALQEGLVRLTDKGEALLDETWNEMCDLFDADPDAEYRSDDHSIWKDF